MENKNIRKNKSKIVGIALFWLGIVGTIVSLWMISSDFKRIDAGITDTVAWGFTIDVPLLLISLVLALLGAIFWFLVWSKERKL